MLSHPPSRQFRPQSFCCRTKRSSPCVRCGFCVFFVSPPFTPRLCTRARRRLVYFPRQMLLWLLWVILAVTLVPGVPSLRAEATYLRSRVPIKLVFARLPPCRTTPSILSYPTLSYPIVSSAPHPPWRCASRGSATFTSCTSLSREELLLALGRSSR